MPLAGGFRVPQAVTFSIEEKTHLAVLGLYLAVVFLSWGVIAWLAIREM
jgi:hypothetical protein